MTEAKKKPKRSCVCGCQQFIAMQIQHVEVITNQDGEIENGSKSLFSETSAFGPFQCVECDRVFRELPDSLPCTEEVQID